MSSQPNGGDGGTGATDTGGPVGPETSAANATETQDAGSVPDPDMDDLDDLDDLDEMLDDFSAAKIDAKEQPVPTGPGRPAGPSSTAVPPTSGAMPAATGAHAEDTLEDDDEFEKQLQAGMENLLKEVNTSPELQAELEAMFGVMEKAAADQKPGGGGSSSKSAKPSSSPGAGKGAAAAAAASEASFQDTIRRTMERMQTSGESATAAAAADSNSGDDFMAELLRQMQADGMGGDGAPGNEEDFSKMLLGMMQQLTTKEILYEPMKELDTNFPAWLEKNAATTSAEDMERYELQRSIVREIVGKFEEKGYADENAADRDYIVTRMQKMQEAGQPPPDLVGDMPSAQDAFNMPDESCNPQ